MDDHMYDNMRAYAECELIPRFQEDYKTYGNILDCPSYPEIRDLCKALNIVAPYAGYSKITPADFI